MNRVKKITICVLLFLLMTKSDYAGAWGEAFEATFWDEAWQRMTKQIDDTMLASVKTQATVVMSQKIKMLVFGGGGGFITNYNSFIFNNSQKSGQVMVGDVFRSLNSNVSGGVRANNRNVEMAVNTRLSGLQAQGRANIDRLVNGGSGNVFVSSQGGGRTAFMASIANPFNNPLGTYLQTSSAVDETIRRQQIVAQTEAIAGQGFLSQKTADNLIKMPASTLKDMASSMENMPDRIMEAAKDVPGTLAAMALKTGVQAGFQMVSAPLDPVLNQMHQQFGGGIQTVAGAITSGQKESVEDEAKKSADALRQLKEVNPNSAYEADQAEAEAAKSAEALRTLKGDSYPAQQTIDTTQGLPWEQKSLDPEKIYPWQH